LQKDGTQSTAEPVGTCEEGAEKKTGSNGKERKKGVTQSD